MANGQLRTVIHQLRRLIGGGGGCTLTDAQLLEDYVLRGSETSFEVLVWRHGTMVFNLCQRVLRDSHTAEDAFQAAFLVFARKAGSIGKGEAVGSWLYKVAYRIALRVRSKMAKKVALEELADDLPARQETDTVMWCDLRPVLDQEIDRLPEKYKVPFLLCYLQGHTNEEAAEQLGCPKGTILSRLARGRERLRLRLVQRGLALSVAGLTTMLLQNASSAAAPATLVSSTTKAAVLFAAGKAVTGLIPASVVALTEGVLHTMFLTKLKIVAAALLALAVIGTGTGWVVHQAVAGAAPKLEAVVELTAEEEEAAQRRPAADVSDFTGKVVAVAKDGKSITLEVRPTMRGAEPMKVEIKLNDKTAIKYNAIGPNGAKPTEGYEAQVKLAEGSKDVAGSVNFNGSQNFRIPDFTGRVTGVVKDGQGITMQTAARSRVDDGKEIGIKFTDKTVIAFFGVTTDEAKLAAGLDVLVWIAHGPKGSGPTATNVRLIGSKQVQQRGDPAADAMGKVVAVSNDGKTITLAEFTAARGQEPKKIEVKLSDKTVVVYNNVGLDGAKVADGYQANVWWEPGSKDSAARVYFRGVLKETGTQIVGRVIGVAKDGKSFTLASGSLGRGGEEPKKTEIKLGDNTRISYTNVGPDQAKLTEGYLAVVVLQEGSKDTAAQVGFSFSTMMR